MPLHANHKHRWGVILSGGDGVRLRPLTRVLTGDDRPKQFCALVGDKTLLTQTRDRAARTVQSDRTLFALTKSHEPYYAAELSDVPPQQMVVQPDNRGTLPAILWSLIRMVRFDRQAVVAFFPSDHHYADERKLTAGVSAAFQAAEVAPSSVVLLGASATAPEVEYGWIQPEARANDSKLLRVRRFWEKPSSEIAQELLEEGCLWNTFVMIGRACAFLDLIQSAEPGLHETFQTALMQDGADMNPEFMRGVYEQIPTADFSKRILSQATERLAVLSLGDVGWDDLGDPRRVSALLHTISSRRAVSSAVLGSQVAATAVA